MAEPFRRTSERTSIGRTLRSKRTNTFEAIEDLLAVVRFRQDDPDRAVVRHEETRHQSRVDV